MNDEKNVILLDARSIKDLVYDIRGQKVMLDFDLARIYGYETRYFNRQVKNNIDKFDNDFMSQLSTEEVRQVVMCKKFTSRKVTFFSGQIGGTRKPPYAFTEQGIYMLMTVLHGDLAVQQSKTLIRLFKSMKDYIAETNMLGSTNEVLALANQVHANTEAIAEIRGQLDVVMDNFIDPSTYKSFLIMDGEKVESDLAYQRIYAMAKQSVFVIDDYIDIKTIQLLKSCGIGINITVFSDNKAKNALTKTFVADFLNDRIDLSIQFKKTNGRFHDRYIILDFPSKTRVFHCGASSKDGGNKITTIMEVEEPETYHGLISRILLNDELAFPR